MKQQVINNLRIVVLLAGAFISILNQTLMITAIPPIMKMNITASLLSLLRLYYACEWNYDPGGAFLLERFQSKAALYISNEYFAFGTIVAGIALISKFYYWEGRSYSQVRQAVCFHSCKRYS